MRMSTHTNNTDTEIKGSALKFCPTVILNVAKWACATVTALTASRGHNLMTDLPSTK